MYRKSTEKNRTAERDFSHRRVKLDCFPYMLAVYTTDACNLRCVGCHFGKRVAPKISISKQGYQRIIDVFPFVKTIGIAGAEMFYDAGNPEGHMNRIFKEGEKYSHIRFVGFTNATLLTSERIALIIEKFDWIGISIDSPYPEVYKNIRVGGRLEHVITNIKKISELKAEKGLGRAGKPRIILSSVIMELTYKSVKQIVELAYEVGAAQLNFLDPWEGTYEEGNIFHDRVKTMEYLDRRKEADVLARGLGITIQDRTRNTIIHNMPDLKDHVVFLETDMVGKWPNCCNAPWNELYIWRNGDVKICCTSSTVIGNINDNGIFEIWNSQVAIDVRRRILKGNYAKDCQKNCHRGYVLPQLRRKRLLSYF